MKEIIVKTKYEKLVGLPIEVDKVSVSDGLIKHIQKRHPNMIRYIDDIGYILNNPDYLGFNANQPSDSFECIKVLSDNVLVAVKLDSKNGYYYVASIYDVKDSKLAHMVRNGRLIRI
ncbi:hypothetical protein KBI51_01910 [Aerococcaceae bacterium zg-ZUI334]|uniref:PBECR3 domain-containing polyvalent protein n=1 Tax=Aerococcaceae bacterium zg-252 TaxID=2796928 RepID=UPI001B985E90|nr:hypothetical protein [Aerococcaceae bacterium zg-ZUI334]